MGNSAAPSERRAPAYSPTAGPTAAFALAGSAGTFAMLTTLLRSRTLAPQPTSAIADTDTDTKRVIAASTAKVCTVSELAARVAPPAA